MQWFWQEHASLNEQHLLIWHLLPKLWSFEHGVKAGVFRQLDTSDLEPHQK